MGLRFTFFNFDKMTVNGKYCLSGIIEMSMNRELKIAAFSEQHHKSFNYEEVLT